MEKERLQGRGSLGWVKLKNMGLSDDREGDPWALANRVTLDLEEAGDMREREVLGGQTECKEQGRRDKKTEVSWSQAATFFFHLG